MIRLFKPHIPENLDFSDIFANTAFSYGKYSMQFEDKLREYFGVDNLLVTIEYSSALDVIITTLGLQPGDEVIMSPMSCLVSTQPYITHYLKVVWADVDPKTGLLDPDSVRSKISSKTRLIVHNHFCGYVGKIDEINEIGKEYKIFVLDDGIECFGSEYKGKKVGNCGTDITCFSFSPARFPNTVGGGLIIFKDKNLYKKSLLIRDCGIDRKLFRKPNGEIDPSCDISLPGYSVTLNDLNGYIGLREMDYLNFVLNKQRINAKKWLNILPNGITIKPYSESSPNYWVFGVLVDNKNEYIEEMRKKGFYASGVHMRNDIYSVFGSQSKLPGVTKFMNSFVALPCGWWVNEDEIKI